MNENPVIQIMSIGDANVFDLHNAFPHFQNSGYYPMTHRGKRFRIYEKDGAYVIEQEKSTNKGTMVVGVSSEKIRRPLIEQYEQEKHQGELK